MFLFLNVFFILKLHAHTEWHIVNSIDNVLYCQFVCCWFCSFWDFLWIFFVFFSPHATTVLWNRERKFSICFHCLEQEKKKSIIQFGCLLHKRTMTLVELFLSYFSHRDHPCCLTFWREFVFYLFQICGTHTLVPYFYTCRVKRRVHLPIFMESYCELLCRYVQVVFSAKIFCTI